MPKHLIVISGPTAVGKTALSLDLAKEFNSPIISADSRQLYNELNIGTAKPTKEELEQTKHYFINHLSIKDPFSTGQYERECIQLLTTLFTKHDYLLLVGGTGLYIQSAIEGLDQFPEIDENAKQSIQSQLQTKTIVEQQELLKELDPDYAKTVDLQNARRIERALMICLSSGNPYSSYLNKEKPKRPFNVHKIRLDIPREKLYERINLRVDQMIKNGLLDEVERLLVHQQLRAMATVGYQEFFPYFKNEIPLAEAIEKVKTHSRRYAKRQSTWLNKYFTKKVWSPENNLGIINHLYNELNISN